MDLHHAGDEIPGDQGVVHPRVAGGHPVADVRHGVQGRHGLGGIDRVPGALRQGIQVAAAGMAVSIGGIDEDLGFGKVRDAPPGPQPEGIHLRPGLADHLTIQHVSCSFFALRLIY